MHELLQRILALSYCVTLRRVQYSTLAIMRREMSEFTVNFKGSFRCSKACRHTLLQWRICRPRERCYIGIAIMHVATTLGIIVMFHLRRLGLDPRSS